MARTLTVAAARATPADRVAFADTALALADLEVTAPALRAIVGRAARNEMTGDEATRRSWTAARRDGPGV